MFIGFGDPLPCGKLYATLRDMSESATIPEWSLPERLGKARQTAGLTPLEMASRLGVTDRTVRNWESGATRVTKAQVIAYAAVTKVPAAWIEGHYDAGMTDMATYRTRTQAVA